MNFTDTKLTVEVREINVRAQGKNGEMFFFCFYLTGSLRLPVKAEVGSFYKNNF